MAGFKYFKYDSRRKEEMKQIEDLLAMKMKKWKYDPFGLKGHALENILKVVSHHMDNAKKIERDIREKTLRNLMPNLTNKEIKEAMSKHEDKNTPRFKAFQILSNKIEDVV